MALTESHPALLQSLPPDPTLPPSEVTQELGGPGSQGKDDGKEPALVFQIPHAIQTHLKLTFSPRFISKVGWGELVFKWE